MSTASRAARPASLMLAGLFLVFFMVPDAHAQFGKLKEKVKQRTDQVTGQAIDEGLDQVDPTKQKPAPTQAPAEAPAEESPVQPASVQSGSAPGAPAATPVAAREWANYDFVPGSKVLFDTDFTEDKVGNFPQRLEFAEGTMEVVELGGLRMLKASDHGRFIVPLPKVLPERYTIEIDYLQKNDYWNAVEVSGGREPPDEDTRFIVGVKRVEVVTSHRQQIGSDFSHEQVAALTGTLVHLRAQGDGAYLKVYNNERRIANVPNARVERANGLWVVLAGADGGDRPVYISRIRVAETEASVYDALSSTGRWATQGILFETGRSDVKPESTPTLKEIAAALKGHPELKVEIQGHTDNVGKPADNLKLSDARAAAVKAALVSQYGVSEAQLTTKGYGDTKPVADNKTAEGRQNNRRVELVKL